MSPPSWTLDPNVLVSGVLSPSGPPARLIDALLGGTLRLTLDDRILREYEEVLSRPRFGLSPAEIDALFAVLHLQDRVAPPPWPLAVPDPDDLPFLEAARLATDRVLVTGNTRHFPAASRQDVRVLTPAEAWTLLTATE